MGKIETKQNREGEICFVQPMPKDTGAEDVSCVPPVAAPVSPSNAGQPKY